MDEILTGIHKESNGLPANSRSEPVSAGRLDISQWGTKTGEPARIPSLLYLGLNRGYSRLGSDAIVASLRYEACQNAQEGDPAYFCRVGRLIVKALVLSGGGARGAYEAGVLCGLANAGERFDLVCGTSIGAINASFLVQDLLPDLEHFWRSIASRNIIRLIPQAQHVQEFVTGFEDFLKLPLDAKIFRLPHIIELYGRIGSKVALLSLLGVVDRAPLTAILTGKLNVNNLKCSLIITATNITQETADTFYAFVRTDGASDEARVQSDFLGRVRSQTYLLSNTNFLSAVEASASIPLAFEPVKFNHGTGRDFYYVDGGVANNTPIGFAIAAGATDITVIFMDPEVTAPPYQMIPNAAVLGMACYDVMQQKILADDMKLAVMTNKALSAADSQEQKELGLEDKVQVTLRVVRPKLPLDLTVLAFGDQAKLTAAFEVGRSDASQIQTVWSPK